MKRDADTLTFDAAKRHAEYYSAIYHDSLTQEHDAAMDRWDCEAFLQVGIDAAQWFLRADQELRLRAYEQGRDTDPAAQAALESWFRDWLAPCEKAEHWVTIVSAQGRAPDNLERFRSICHEMRAIVEALDDSVTDELPVGLIPLRDGAIEEERNGQTTEFV